VPAGQAGTIISYLQLSKSGKYDVKGYISYAGKQTETKELTINVIGAGKTSNLLYVVLGSLVAVIAILTGIFFIIRNNRKPHQDNVS
jgi:hypothetical protein